MKFSKYISKAVTPVMALFQKQHSCLSNKATTICGYSVCSLRQVPVRHNRGGKSTENKVRLAPPTMCRLTVWTDGQEKLPGFFTISATVESTAQGRGLAIRSFSHSFPTTGSSGSSCCPNSRFIFLIVLFSSSFAWHN